MSVISRKSNSWLLGLLVSSLTVAKTQQEGCSQLPAAVKYLRYHYFNCDICPILNVVGLLTGLKLSRSPLLNLGQNYDRK